VPLVLVLLVIGFVPDTVPRLPGMLKEWGYL
jgi:hypothetical protein